MIRQVSSKGIREFECLSTDNIDALLNSAEIGVDGTFPLTLQDVGASMFAVDTGIVWKLNTTSDKKTLKWYQL